MLKHGVCRWDKIDNMNAKTPSALAGSAVAGAAAVAAVSLHLFLAESSQQSHQLSLFVRLLINIKRL